MNKLTSYTIFDSPNLTMSLDSIPDENGIGLNRWLDMRLLHFRIDI